VTAGGLVVADGDAVDNRGPQALLKVYHVWAHDKELIRIAPFGCFAQLENQTLRTI
jgi:hypothetical protein